MQVSASEGLANHTVPETCAETREGFGEALTGVRIGWVLSPGGTPADDSHLRSRCHLMSIEPKGRRP